MKLYTVHFIIANIHFDSKQHKNTHINTISAINVIQVLILAVTWSVVKTVLVVLCRGSNSNCVNVSDFFKVDTVDGDGISLFT